MKKLTFYHQKRRDGGVRTGVELEGDPILEKFEPGSTDEDSKLLWWIDVRCFPTALSAEPEEVRNWLKLHAPLIESALTGLAEKVSVGIDSDWPAKHITQDGAGTEIEVLCSAMRRIEGRDIATELRKLAKDWQATINQLQSFVTAAP